MSGKASKVSFTASLKIYGLPIKIGTSEEFLMFLSFPDQVAKTIPLN